MSSPVPAYGTGWKDSRISAHTHPDQERLDDLLGYVETANGRYAKALVDLAAARQALRDHHDPDRDCQAWAADDCPVCLSAIEGGNG